MNEINDTATIWKETLYSLKTASFNRTEKGAGGRIECHEVVEEERAGTQDSSLQLADQVTSTRDVPIAAENDEEGGL